MAEKNEFINKRIICRGGLISTRNWLDLNDNYASFAASLVNFEPSLFGGYRRINGFVPLEANEPEVDPANAEGPILGVFFFGDSIMCARKEQSGSTYNFYTWNPSVGWIAATIGFPLVSTDVTRVRYDTWNFDGTEHIGFVDGVNGLVVYDGTTWVQITTDVTNTQMINDVSLIRVYQNHIFLSGSATYPHLVIHSAPEDHDDFSSGNGAGQIVAAFPVNQIMPFREQLYVFGEKRIKKIRVEQTSFLIDDVVQDLGCLAGDSVVELNGDLIFLAQDGFRPISATEKIGDIELASISKTIQRDVLDLLRVYQAQDIKSVVIRGKSQARWFFSSSATPEENSLGILAGIQDGPNGQSFEWGILQGIKASCTDSQYIGTSEFVIHGTYDGRVMRQEIGNTFDSEPIRSIYQTPFLDFGDTELRKTVRNIRVFVRPEGSMSLDLGLKFDWDNAGTLNPQSYDVFSGGSPGVYGIAIYGIDVYGGITVPAENIPVSGSCWSLQVALVDSGSSAPFSIQSIVIEFSTDGRE